MRKIRNKNIKRSKLNVLVTLMLLLLSGNMVSSSAQSFVHPGLSHKKSDLDRMKYMVEAKIDPWYSSYKHMCELPTAQHTYTVQGSTDIWNFGVDRGWKDPWFDADARAAYYGALRWYIEEDERYADKAIEAIMAWTGLTNHPGMSLKTAPIWLMIEAAEIVKHTYDGWAEEDIKKFEDMLVYPGYSSVKAPSGNKTWYWNAYLFDNARAGNQELCGVRTVAAIGVFIDNKKIYDRAMRYVSNLPARTDDLPGIRGPRIRGPISESGSNEFSISYTVPNPENTNKYPDWGFCGVLPYNIYPNGQNVESSRDQGHTCFSLGMLSTIGEIGWTQGYNFYGLLDSRIVKGLEYTLRYCVSNTKSFPDQTVAWEPSTFINLDDLNLEEPRLEDASYDFIQITNRTKRNSGKTISSISREGFTNINSWELPIAHYVGRGLKKEEDLKWTIRARDYSREKNGHYEPASTGQDYTGYGGLVYYRPDGCMGDPITGFIDTFPIYDMNVVPCVIEAENYDYNPVNAEGRIYHDTDEENTGSYYRTDQGVDIDTCAEGGYQLTNLDDGEWLTYTIAVREAGYYNISFRYAASNGDGKIQLAFANEDKSEEVSIPFGGENSTGLDAYADVTVGSNVLLQAGVQAMKVKISGAANSFVINSISIDKDLSLTHIEGEDYSNMSGVTVESTSDSEGKSHVTSFNNKDWMEYEIFIPFTQNYKFLYRMASATAGEYTVILGNDTIEQFAYSATGGANTWESQVSQGTYPLPAGNQTLKIVANTSGSKLNWIDLVKDEANCDITEIVPFFSVSNPGGIDLGTEQTDSIAVIPGYGLKLSANPEIGGTWLWSGPDGFTSTDRELSFNAIATENSGEYEVTYVNDCGSTSKDTFVINVTESFFVEAESFSSMSGVTTDAIPDQTGKFMVNGIDKDDYLEYEVNIPFTGTYIVNYKVSGASYAGEFSLSAGEEFLETIGFGTTGSENTWTTVSSAEAFVLSEGLTTLQLKANTSGWNIDNFNLNLQDQIRPCELPMMVDELTFIGENATWSSGLMDLSCAEHINIFMDLAGEGELDASDYLRIYYKVDGQEKVSMLENVGVLAASKLAQTGISGKYIEIIAEANTAGTGKRYTITDLKISKPPVFERIEAEDFYSMFGIQTQSTSDVNGNENVGWVHNGDWLMYKDVDLTGAMSFEMRYSSPESGNYVEMRLDSENGPLIGKMDLNKTGNWNSWRLQTANIIATDGIYDVYFILKGGDGYLFNINWFKLSSNLLPVSSESSIFSTVYLVLQNEKVIMIPKQASISVFKENLSPSENATFEVYRADGTTIAPYVAANFMVIVTAEDGLHQTIYTVDYNTGFKETLKDKLSVHPNPAKDKLTIKTASDGAKFYRVIDMFGRCIADGTFTTGRSEHELDIADWSKGIYILQLSNKHGQGSIKLIKE